MTMRSFQSAILIRKEDRTPAQQLSVEKLEEIKKEGDRFRRIIEAARRPKGDIPIRPKPVLPDLTDLGVVEYDLNSPKIVKLEAQLLDLREQYTLISNRLAQIPDEVLGLEKQFARDSKPEVEESLARLERELKVTRAHRLPDLHSRISEVELELESAVVEARDGIVSQLSDQVKEIDLEIASLLRQALILRVRSDAAREIANGLISSTGRHLADSIKLFGRLIFDVWDRPRADHVRSFESKVAERLPEEFHYKRSTS